MKRSFAFSVDSSLKPLARTAAEKRIMSLIEGVDGQGAIGGQIRENNKGVLGLAGIVGKSIAGQRLTAIQSSEGYVGVTLKAYPKSSFPEPTAHTPPKLETSVKNVALRQVTESQAAWTRYQNVLRSLGDKPVGAGPKGFEEIHAAAGAAHDSFVAYRTHNDIYMDPTQAVPYAHLSAKVAVLDADPAIAYLKALKAELKAR